jgi:bacillithiol biosynthesis cysteine-adding enzyme BshC
VTPTLGTTPSLPIDIRRFPWVRRLVADYAHDYGRVAGFFNGNPSDPAAWREAIARAQAHPRQRAALAMLLQAQQRARGAPREATAAAAQLEDPRTVAVVTGQQAGLFGGPLFTLLKALSAIQLAERVRLRHQVPAVAVFWIDAEDHDWNEVKRCGVLDPDLALRSVEIGDPPGAGSSPVAQVRLDESVLAAIAGLETALAPTEFLADVIGDVKRIYQPGRGMAECFGRMLELLLGSRGLVVYDAADPAAKPLVADVFAGEVAHPGRTARLAARAGAGLERQGYHAQATPQDGGVALFHLNGGREAVRASGDGAFRVGTREVAAADLLARVRQSPAAFSPNVLLRPIVQDTIFPTVCYVSGPSELAYLGQLKGVYEAFGVPMPLVQQRGTATILDANGMRFLTRHQVPLEILRTQDEAALNDLLTAQLPPGIDTALDRTARLLEEQMLELARTVTQIDTTLDGAARSTLTRMQDDLRRLQGKIVQAAKRKDDTLRRQFRHAQAQAFPGGQPQERAIGVVFFLNKYGPALIDRLAEIMPGESGTHYVLTV